MFGNKKKSHALFSKLCYIFVPIVLLKHGYINIQHTFTLNSKFILKESFANCSVNYSRFTEIKQFENNIKSPFAE